MIRTYLNRYLEGESTQEELRQLREYLCSTPDLPADLIPYAKMFALLEEKQPTPSRQALDRFSAERAPSSRLRVILWPPSAAACITAAWLLLNRHKEQADLRLGTEALTEIFSHEYEPEQLTQLFNEP